MTTHIWLRAEDKPMEERTALTPQVAKKLLEAGFKITVEHSEQAALKAEAFAEVGCELAESGAWLSAPEDTIILGLKELNEDQFPLVHRHIHFAHVYKNQAGWQGVLKRFVKGGGSLYDLEYLTEPSGRRVAAFGYWAGYTGAAVALLTWMGQQLEREPVLAALSAKASKDVLLNEIAAETSKLKDVDAKAPKALVIGALGRSGCGAMELFESAGVEVVGWDIEETSKGGPFPEILEFDIMVNCVFVQGAVPPFITSEMLDAKNRVLSVISDVSCDPYGDYNPLPIYKQCTTFDKPTLRLIDGKNPLDLISIDHLPSMLPVEASEDFCGLLSEHLLQLDDLSQGVWGRANSVFKEKTAQIQA